MNTYLELAKMVCMGWRPQSAAYAGDLLKRYFTGTPSLGHAEKFLIEEALWVLDHSLSSEISATTESYDDMASAIKTVASVKKRRGCPPGGWPKKEAKHD